MNYGCHGATVEMQGTSSISHCVATGLVVSGVEATSIRSTLSPTISSLATSAARFGFDWLSLTDDLDRIGRAADLDAVFHRLEKVRDDEIVGFGEGGERPGLRADVAELDAFRGLHGGREHRTCGERCSQSRPTPS